MNATSVGRSLDAAMPGRSQRPGQSTRGSLIEAFVNVGLGFVIAVVTQCLVFPLAGLHVTLATDLLMAGAFTLISLARTFAVRRLFEWLGSRRGHRREVI